MSRLVRVISLAVLANIAVAGHAWAHAHLKAAVPAAQAAVASPSGLDLTFSESVNPSFSGVRLTGPDQQEVRLEAVSLADGGKTLRAPVAVKLAPGVYSVDWHVLSVDGHKTSGAYRFTVKP
ncbi:copper homeostasis periplasmic binding protein CopC [Pseudoduganella sp. FT25W]|jgi:methionine-rich copper-binding protein CopC|uniref:Copper homeostasis periplasmic binding protein CopC n=1 Tax=Duganella alba TaxID=2666081 RepID=A0A6L5QQ28_9BURK|nr:copper homeostasis periplasmic binding protein CopC [Duganella alba]MRX11795.1 copper homeostasis periplasmic binding protein CopC [Duganella alba]MRX19969.1 copper homeostasis periplasmic binding protein CopC [Duganella alba]